MTPNMPSSGRVDVLAVLSEAYSDYSHPRFTDRHQLAPRLREARAAVSELIVAACDVAAELTCDPAPGTPLARLDAALANIGAAP